MLENLKRKRIQSLKSQYLKIDLEPQNLLWAIDRVYHSDSVSLLPQPRSTKVDNDFFFDTKSRFEKVDDVEFTMLACPSGSFVQGNELLVYLDLKTHKIESPFLLGETLVTQELYQKVMGNNPSNFIERRIAENTYEKIPKNPVEEILWQDAILFCNKLSEMQGLDVCYTKKSNLAYDWHYDSKKNGYRLPTEKEWEYAAKAGTKNRWAGTDVEESVDDYAWFHENSKGSTQPVKTKKPNEWGFYDMSGNVYEWCWDKYDPKNHKLIAARCIRGGHWYTEHKTDLQISNRQSHDLNSRESSVGFRIARSILK